MDMAEQGIYDIRQGREATGLTRIDDKYYSGTLTTGCSGWARGTAAPIWAFPTVLPHWIR